MNYKKWRREKVSEELSSKLQQEEETFSTLEYILMGTSSQSAFFCLRIFYPKMVRIIHETEEEEEKDNKKNWSCVAFVLTFSL